MVSMDEDELKEIVIGDEEEVDGKEEGGWTEGNGGLIDVAWGVPRMCTYVRYAFLDVMMGV